MDANKEPFSECIWLNFLVWFRDRRAKEVGDRWRGRHVGWICRRHQSDPTSVVCQNIQIRLLINNIIIIGAKSFIMLIFVIILKAEGLCCSWEVVEWWRKNFERWSGLPSPGKVSLWTSKVLKYILYQPLDYYSHTLHIQNPLFHTIINSPIKPTVSFDTHMYLNDVSCVCVAAGEGFRQSLCLLAIVSMSIMDSKFTDEPLKLKRDVFVHWNIAFEFAQYFFLF